jgi:putative membrane protein
MVVMMFWDDGGWAWWQAGLMWFAVIMLTALLILTVYALVTGITRKPDRAGHDAPRPGGARRILDERLARGEIEPEEYRRLREALDGSPGRPAGTGSGG